MLLKKTTTRCSMLCLTVVLAQLRLLCWQRTVMVNHSTLVCPGLSHRPSPSQGRVCLNPVVDEPLYLACSATSWQPMVRVPATTRWRMSHQRLRSHITPLNNLLHPRAAHMKLCSSFSSCKQLGFAVCSCRQAVVRQQTYMWKDRKSKGSLSTAQSSGPCGEVSYGLACITSAYRACKEEHVQYALRILKQDSTVDVSSRQSTCLLPYHTLQRMRTATDSWSKMACCFPPHPSTHLCGRSPGTHPAHM
jgi:hypothetical protein